MQKIFSIFFIILVLNFVVPKPVYAQTSVPILLYHYIGNNPNLNDTARNTLSVPPVKFDEQMGYLSKNGYTPISLDTLYGIFNKQTAAPAKPVVLTFDDGYMDFYYNAFPILSKYNFHAVSFIPTGLMGGGYYMNWDQIKQIQSSGLVTFEDHTVSHMSLTALSFDRAYKEILDSKNILQSQTGYPVNFIAYPNGVSNNNVYAAAQKAGIVGGLGTWKGKAGGPSYNMPRIRITGQMSLQDFISRL